MAASTNTALERVPPYVLDHAPLLHLFSTDPYRPSSPAATLLHTRPQIAFKDTPIPSPPLTLDNLDQLNSVGSNGGTDVYLTSYEDVTKDPGWIKGEKIGAGGGGGGGGDEDNAEKTAVVIVVDKGDGVVDAFYFYFFAFNWGGVVLEKQLGDHIGDWEHNMIRFIKGEPKYVWFSQHANGEAYTFSALKKDGSGKRPIVYCANGSHALYPTPGTHDHTIPNFNLPFRLLLVDETDKGPLYDPLATTSFYTTSTSTSTLTFHPLHPTPTAPANFLTYRGRWGDQEYPASDPRQDALLGNKKYVGGPTGPADKGLDRKDVWPANSFSNGQRIRRSLGVGLGLGTLKKVRGWVGRLRCASGGGEGRVRRVLVSGEVVG